MCYGRYYKEPEKTKEVIKNGYLYTGDKGEIDQDGYLSLVIPPTNRILRRQDAPDVFDMTTVAYVVSQQFVHEHDSPLGGRVRSVYVPRERALDIDTLLDFRIAECLMDGNEGSSA